MISALLLFQKCNNPCPLAFFPPVCYNEEKRKGGIPMQDDEKLLRNRLKILYLYQILLRETDEGHSITMPQIIDLLAEKGVSAARKALYEDIRALELYGLDIQSGRGSNSSYQVLDREFSLPELRLLAGAVDSARFLTEKKSKELLHKIGTLTSVHEARELQRDIFVADRVKAVNERIYYTVNEISRAINAGRQISFGYTKYVIDHNARGHLRLDPGDGRRTCSPYALTWADERYYLIGYYPKYGEISQFRVDRMEDVQILDDPCETDPEFDLPAYLNASFSMFSGNTRTVGLRFSNKLINAVIDRFGKDIPIQADPDGAHFTVHVSVNVQKPFYGWLFGFGSDAEILSPPEVRAEYREILRDVLDLHEK